ncbi:hypothetical protein OG215_39725 (plasmid) [Streptomyces globisporus]|nr:hypothetical protein OG215_39725 [Streptomyces globisporus]
MFVLDSVGLAGIEIRIDAPRAAARNPALTAFLRTVWNFSLRDRSHTVPALVAPLVDILRNGPSEPVWRPVHEPDKRVTWTTSAAGITAQ